MTTETNRETAPDELRSDEAARYAEIARDYLYALLAHDAIPSRYERGASWIRREDLDELIVQRERAP
jgi:hypothetical protein